MRQIASLRRELIIGLALLLLASLGLAAVAIWLWLPVLPVGGSIARLFLFLALLIALDVGVFVLFGDYLLRQMVLRPVNTIVDGAESIASGDYSGRIEVEGAHELQRVATSVNEMAERLILNQQRLTENIHSLSQVNRELTEARDELVRAEKLASVGQLAAGIAHEIGNPLGAILGYLDVAGRRPEIGLDLIADMRRETRRIDRIVKGLLDYARPRQPAPRLIEVNEVVRGAIELLDSQGHFKEVDVISDLNDAVPSVDADPHQLEQIMVNLLLNAAQAMEPGNGNRIEVDTGSMLYRMGGPPARRRDDPPGVDYSHLRRLQARREGLTPPPFRAATQVVRITVVDNGRGIPDEIMDRVFDPFFSTKDPGEGTGLGLAVSARLIEGMGGIIEVDSPEEGGARFSVLLPVADGTPAEERESEQ